MTAGFLLLHREPTSVCGGEPPYLAAELERGTSTVREPAPPH